MNDLIKTHENENGELEKLVEKFIDESENFLTVEGLRIFLETQDLELKLNALRFVKSVWL